MRRIFRDNQLNECFQRDGYVLTPLLNEADVYALTSLYHQINSDVSGELSIDFTINSRSPTYRQRMNQGVKRLIGAKAEALFDNYRFFASNYVGKNPGTIELHLHQDNSIVDESQYASVNIWVPLLDVDESNGCLTVVRQSHLWSPQPRAFGDWLSSSPFRDLVAYLHSDKCKRTAPARAGWAVCYDGRTIHGSVPNYSNKLRLAVLSAAIPAELRVRFHHRVNQEMVELFDAGDEFYWQEMFFFSRPKLTPSLGSISVPPAKPWSVDEFEAVRAQTRARFG